MKRLRDELTDIGLKVIVTTSTHILYEPDEPFDSGDDIGNIKRIIDEHGYIVIGRINEPADKGVAKLSSPGSEALIALRDICDVMLIEADGARGKSIKIPAEWEPVIYPWTDLVIALAGADAIGSRIEDAAYRSGDFAAFTGKGISDYVDMDDIVRIAASDKALRKDVGDSEYRFFLNAADSCGDSREAADVIRRLGTEHGITASIGSLHHIDDMGAVVLAAGLGTRFGGDKLRSVINGKAMYRHVLDEIASVIGYESITFVTGGSGPADEAAALGANVVINQRPEDGQASSMRLGLLNNLKYGSCLFAVADQPMICAESINRLITGYRNSNMMMASMTNASGDFANPCIFASCYYDELMRIEGDRGGKSVITKHADDVYRCRADSELELFDIDTGEDLDSFKKRMDIYKGKF